MFRNRPRLTGFLLGLAVMVVCLAYLLWSEPGRRLELAAFDWRVRHCNTLLPTTPIVHVDIDDGSLDRVGRWPWHRDRQARIVDALSALGAASIQIDLLLSEPEPTYLDDPRFDKYAGLGETVDIVGELSDANRVFPDAEMAHALRQAGNVILAAQFDISAADNRAARLESLLDADPNPSPDRAAAELGVTATESRDALEKNLLRLRVRRRLIENFTLDEARLADALDVLPSKISAVIAGAKRDAARQLVAAQFADGVVPARDDVLAAVLGERRSVLNADHEDVLAAYLTQLGLMQVHRAAYPAGDAVLRLARPATNTDPPQHVLAAAARTLASVNFDPDADFGTRRVPVLVRFGDRVVPHMGLAAAAAALGLDLARMSVDPRGRLVLPSRDETAARALPLDGHGNLLIHWTVTAKDWRRGADFPHISAAKLYALVDAERQMDRNRIAMDYRLAEVVAAAKGQVKIENAAGDAQVLHADTAYRHAVNEWLSIRQTMHRAELFPDQAPADLAERRRRWEELSGVIRQEQKQAAAAVRAACAEIDQIPAEELESDASLRADAKRFRDAREILDRDLPRLEAANREHERTIADLKKELEPVIRGRHVFIGFAATAQGDIVPTPIDPRTNGVMCHAHVMNAILQNRFIALPDARVDWLICLLLGAAISYVTATRGPRLALLVAVGLMTFFAVINGYVLFMRLGLWFSLAAPMVTVFVVWAFVTLFRQLTAERDRRAFAKQLSQYTSPVIAAKIAESPEAAAAFKTVQTRDVTCYFSDLAGFTTISEQENAEVVQHVLNTYLERMCKVIWAQRGLINKFMGDGIMAFFNPSVDPLPDHPRIACETALLTLEELDKLIAQSANDPAARVFQRLSLRIGLATGMVKNGDMGSELKADYTVIGDVVNLAARLEPANKVFGTRIMVSNLLHDAVKDYYEFRYLAELQVKGKAATVPVYEVVGRKGTLSAEQREYIERFEAGVELYKSRKWDECIVHFTRLLSRRFDDPGASRYIDACQEFKRFPPDEDWRGALELKEK